LSPLYERLSSYFQAIGVVQAHDMKHKLKHLSSIYQRYFYWGWKVTFSCFCCFFESQMVSL